MTNQEINLTRVNNDVNGNPRFVAHYTEFLPHELSNSTFLQWSGMKYDIALSIANNHLSARRFNNKQYGGGIVFTSYSAQQDVRETIEGFERSEMYNQAYNSVYLWLMNTESLYLQALAIVKKFEDRTYSPNKERRLFTELMEVCEATYKDMCSAGQPHTDRYGKKVRKMKLEVIRLAAAYVLATLEDTAKEG